MLQDGQPQNDGRGGPGQRNSPDAQQLRYGTTRGGPGSTGMPSRNPWAAAGGLAPSGSASSRDHRTVFRRRFGGRVVEVSARMLIVAAVIVLLASYLVAGAVLPVGPKRGTETFHRNFEEPGMRVVVPDEPEPRPVAPPEPEAPSEAPLPVPANPGDVIRSL